MIVNKIELSDSLEKVQTPRPTFAKRIRKSVTRMFARPDMTFEQWERLERKYSPHSSHHAQMYFRDRGGL